MGSERRGDIVGGGERIVGGEGYSNLYVADFTTPVITLGSFDVAQDYDGTSGKTVFGVSSVTSTLSFGTGGFIGTGSIYPTLYTSGTPQGLRYFMAARSPRSRRRR